DAMVRIKDIAKHAHVSSATVSRVLNKDKTLSVSDDTRQKVLQIAREFNYKTYQERRSENQPSSNQTSKKIGIIIGRTFEEEANDPYYVSIRHGIEKECRNQGISNFELFQFHHINDESVIRGVDGLIVVGKISEEDIKGLNPTTDNIVYIDYSHLEDTFDSVIVDFEKVTNQLINHLITVVHNRIGFIGGMHEKHYIKTQTTYQDERQTTFEKRMKEEEMYVADDIHIGKFTMAEGYRLMKSALKQGSLPDAFLVASDQMAIGVINALHEESVQVPEEIAIVSIDGLETSRFSNPPLTTMAVPTEEMGSVGVKLLLDRIQGRDIPLKITVPTNLVVRKSCGG